MIFSLKMVHNAIWKLSWEMLMMANVFFMLSFWVHVFWIGALWACKWYGSHKVFWSVDSTYHLKNMSNCINASRHVHVVSRQDKKVNMNMVNRSLILRHFALWRIKWKRVVVTLKAFNWYIWLSCQLQTFFIWIYCHKIHSFLLTFNIFTFIQNHKVFRKTDWKP